MSFTFRDSPAFMRETLAVTCGASLAGVAAGLAGPGLGVPVVAGAGAAALAGGSLSAAALLHGLPPVRRALLGLFGALSSGTAFLMLGDALDLGARGLWAAGGGGAAVLAMLLGAGEKTSGPSRLLGVAGAMCMGAVGAVALTRIAAFATSASASMVATSAAMAGAYGLWIAAAAGLRRLEAQHDPAVAQATALLAELAEPLRAKLRDGFQSWQAIGAALAADAGMAEDTKDEARRQARQLLLAMLETARTWHQIHAEIETPRLRGLADKLTDLERKAGETTDLATANHLLRAAEALRAQQIALDGLRVGAGRAEAAVDAQGALLERLRLAVAQHRVSDRERLLVELSAVADHVSRLSDDLESLAAAIAEAESLPDRKLLADAERAGRRALAQLEGSEPGEASTSSSDGHPEGERLIRGQVVEVAPRH